MKYSVIEKYKHLELEELTYAQLEADEDTASIKKQNIIVYEPFETIFNHKGVAVLDAVLSSKITHELNGNYSLYVEVIKDARGKYKRIKPLSILKSRGQLFRIPQVDGVKDDGFKLKLYAEHISYDARELFTEDRRANNQPIYEVMTRLLEPDLNNKYSLGESDLDTTASANFINEDFISSLFKKVLPRWSGELERNNFEFTIKKRLGEYKPNLFIRFGKNSKSISVKLDYTELCTKIYPTGKNGITIESINNGVNYLLSSKANDYPIQYPKHIKFDDAETPEELYDLANEYLNKYDTPTKTITVDIIELENNLAYEDLRNAIRMNLGDTVTVFDTDLNLKDELRVISVDIDGETGLKLKVTLGEFAASFADSVTDLEEVTDEISNKVSENIQTSDDIKNQVVKNTTSIEELNSITENLNKDITSTNAEIGQLPALETEYKDDLVGAVNELKNVIDYDPVEGEEEKIGLKQEIASLKFQVQDLEEKLKVITEILVNEGLYPTS